MSTKIEDKPIANAGVDGSPRCAVSPGSAAALRLFKHSDTLRLARKCPYCGGNLTAGINACEQIEDGSWVITDLSIDCDTEPDIDGPEWDDWWREHSWDYCDKWHDLHDGVVHRLRNSVRVEMADHLPNAGCVPRPENAPTPKPKTLESL